MAATSDCRQFEFVNYSPKKHMGIGGQVTALLKHEYPSMIEESRSKKYFTKTWAHYDIIEDEDVMTAADRFKEEFWVNQLVQNVTVF
jgi:hypothetical protein